MDADYEDKYALKYGALEQDFEELQAEAEEVASQLQRANEAKRMLQAEVKFLKKRAMMLKESASRSERIQAPYFLRDAGGEASHYALAQAQVSAGRMWSDGEFHAPTSKTQLAKPLARGPPRMSHSSKSRDVVGVLKTSSSKLTPNGFAPTKKAGKRKISWQDEYSVKA